MIALVEVIASRVSVSVMLILVALIALVEVPCKHIAQKIVLNMAVVPMENVYVIRYVHDMCFFAYLPRILLTFIYFVGLARGNLPIRDSLSTQIQFVLLQLSACLPVIECPRRCSGHGVCQKKMGTDSDHYRCYCQPGYTTEDCSMSKFRHFTLLKFTRGDKHFTYHYY